MRISIATIASALLILPLAASVQAEDGRVYYKDGTRIETEDMELRFNVQLQPRYEYVNEDSARETENSSNFDLRRARFVVSGNVLEEQFSFKLQNDFASTDNGSDLRDAWIQMNNDVANVRFGQTKVPFSRQYQNSSTTLYFAERADVVRLLNRGRDRGLMAHGDAGSVHFAAGVFNGEGTNAGSNDTDHRWAVAADFTCGEYDRGHEGDMEGGDDLGFTVGFSGNYEENSKVGEQQFDEDIWLLNVDGGIRVAGFDVQAEYFYAELDNDAFADDPSIWGAYVQGSYTVDKVGFGLRYGVTDVKDANPVEGGGFNGIEEVTEISAVVNYFLNGHALKAQTQLTFRTEEPISGGSDLDDFEAIFQLSGYF